MQAFQTAPYNGPVLADERYDICNCGYGDQIAILLKHQIAIVALQRTNKLERHADSGEVFTAAFIVQAMGIDNCYCLRQHIARFMMVGDNNVYADGGGKSNLVDSCNSIVNRDHKPHTVVTNDLQSLAVQAVAFPVAMRNIITNVGPGRLKITVKHDGRQYPVAIIISVNSDFFTFCNRPPDALHRPVHIAQRHRIGQGAIPCQKPPDCFLCIKASASQNPNRQRRQSKRLRCMPRGFVVGLPDIPAFDRHIDSPVYDTPPRGGAPRSYHQYE